MTTDQVQSSILCGCGAHMNRSGLCTACENRARLSKAYFGGQREQVLHRDHYQCQLCLDTRQLLVHHRRPGVQRVRLQITLCRRCHPSIHHTLTPRVLWQENHLWRKLWRELHPRTPEQLLLADNVIHAGMQSNLFHFVGAID